MLTSLCLKANTKSYSSERNWKKKLEEWAFNKYLHSKDLATLVHKREKRMRDEGKETEFFHRGKPLSNDRLDNCKRKKLNPEHDGTDDAGAASTPNSITYHTPKPQLELESDDLWEDIGEQESPPTAALANASPISQKSGGSWVQEPVVLDGLVITTTAIFAGCMKAPNCTRGELDVERITPAYPAPAPNEGIGILDEGILRRFTESQLVHYLVEISKMRDITAFAFKRFISLLLQRPISSSICGLHNTACGQQKLAYASLINSATSICGLRDPITVDLKCRNAFLLTLHNEYELAESTYRQILSDTSLENTTFMALINIRCQISLSCLLITAKYRARGYNVLAKYLPAHFMSHAPQLEPSRFQQQGWVIWPSSRAREDNTIESLNVLRILLGKCDERIGLQENEVAVVRDLVRIVTILYNMGFRASEGIMDSFYEEALDQIAARPSQGRERAEIYKHCIRYYESRGDLAMLGRTIEAAGSLLKTDDWHHDLDSATARLSSNVFREGIDTDEHWVDVALTLADKYATTTKTEARSPLITSYLIPDVCKTKIQVVESGKKNNDEWHFIQRKTESMERRRSDEMAIPSEADMQDDSDKEELFPDGDDESDKRSKYGITYTNSTITGVSYSGFMVP